jgi:hypothetical protein
MLVFDLMRGKIGTPQIVEIVKYGVGASVISLAVSIPVDTYFWGL